MTGRDIGSAVFGGTGTFSAAVAVSVFFFLAGALFSLLAGGRSRFPLPRAMVPGAQLPALEQQDLG